MLANRFSFLALFTFLSCGVISPVYATSESAPSNVPHVVASITPLQLIASDLLVGITTPDVLLPPGASPHQYSLKPSDVRKLKSADLVIWVGPELERFLEKAVSQTRATQLQLLTAEMLEEEPADHDGHAHEEAAQDDGHDHGSVDPHIWLDPYHALHIAEEIHHVLSEKFPAYSEQLDRNMDRFSTSLVEQDKVLVQTFALLSHQGFLVFHDAYGRFIEHYQLNLLGSVTINPSRKPGAKRLGELREKVETSQAVCMFSQPQFSSAVVEAIVAKTQAKVAEVDPLGQNIVLGEGAYKRFLDAFSQPFIRCLTP